MTARLHSHFRSSAAFRARIALNLKGVAFETIARDLRAGGQHAPEYLDLNPAGLVPALEIDGLVLTQSLAIIEYLDETRPAPPFLPADPPGRARVRALAYACAVDIHPIDNLRVRRYLRTPLGHDAATVDAWYAHWIEIGFDALEQSLADGGTGQFCHGDTPTLADICLIPQSWNAAAAGIDLGRWPTIRRIYDAALALPAFNQARPERQPDAPAQ